MRQRGKLFSMDGWDDENIHNTNYAPRTFGICWTISGTDYDYQPQYSVHRGFRELPCSGERNHKLLLGGGCDAGVSKRRTLSSYLAVEGNWNNKHHRQWGSCPNSQWNCGHHRAYASIRDASFALKIA